MKIKELLNKQRELDTFIAKEKNLGDPYDTKWLESRKLALLVEVAELANATRCFKYWSVKGPESKERLLDETADIIHFCSSLMNFDPNKYNLEESINSYFEEYEGFLKMGAKMPKLETTFNLIFEEAAGDEWQDVFENICAVNFILGHTGEEVKQAYLKKHEVNYKRQVEGY